MGLRWYEELSEADKPLVEACGPVQTSESEAFCVGATCAANNAGEMQALIEALFCASCVEQDIQVAVWNRRCSAEASPFAQAAWGSFQVLGTHEKGDFGHERRRSTCWLP